ncbi:MAG TPA: SpoIIE family protein phosphatase [Vicinamibacteria bacterium]|nr:SpoIIE family protein phosphatase [Vicinamibacteria bacterium]
MAEKVLIVDDTLINQKILAAILKKAGFEYAVAGDGVQALAAVRGDPPDLILLDIMMPAKDGYEVCAELKADPRTADIPIIFLSALGEASDKVKGLSLGAADYIAKPFDNAEVQARVETQLRLRRLTQSLIKLNRDLLDKQQALEEDLKAAADIQKALIPRPDLRFPGLELATVFEPCATIGGDVFTAFRLDEEHLAFYILDVNGHGVPAAMVAVSASQSLSPGSGIVLRRTDGVAITPPEQVLAELDVEFPLSRFDRYFTIVYLVLHLPTGLMRYSGAGHPLPILQRTDGTIEHLEEGGPLIGLGGIPFDRGERRLGPGDRVFLYTDGLTEAAEPGGALFGTARLEELVRSQRRTSLQESCQAIDRAVREFSAGAPPSDDVSLLAFEYQGVGS